MKRRVFRIPVFALLALLTGNIEVSFSQAQRPNSDRVNCCQDTKAKEGDGIIAVINGSTIIREKEIDDAIGSQLYSLQERIYNLRKKALENLITQLLLKEEAGKRGVTEEELRKQLMPNKVDIKQSDVDKSYADILTTLENMNEDEAKQRIRLDLESRLKLDLYKTAVSEVTNKARIETFLSVPVPPSSRINAEGPSRGPRDAPVTIVEFSDFQCPYCKQAAISLKPVIEGYGSNIRLVFKQMPLPIHPEAFKTAQASVCAAEQGKFWEFHDILFSSGDLSEQALKKYALSLGLTMNEFNTCLGSETSAAVVRRDMQEAMRADVQGTPTFFVNGRIVRGIRNVEDFKNVIDQALQQGHKEAKPTSTR
jgi:protein-disulfide isomerase